MLHFGVCAHTTIASTCDLFVSFADESISWVQCEKCELWFHFVCIGVDPKHLAKADYFCVICKLPNDSCHTSDDDNDVLKPTDILISRNTASSSDDDDSDINSHDLPLSRCSSSSGQSALSQSLSNLSTASSHRFKQIVLDSNC